MEPEPRIAFMLVQAGEGSVLDGPMLVNRGDKWQAVDIATATSLGRQGDWALAQDDGWLVVDLSLGKPVADGAGQAWFWPTGIPVPTQ